MKIRTVFNYNYEEENYEKNTLPSKTILEDFETLEEKLARFAGIYPSDKGLEYSEAVFMGPLFQQLYLPHYFVEEPIEEQCCKVKKLRKKY